ncbi:MAG TPA: hypothetical protein PK500_00225 [Candidatus Egerieousia sp.]|nr:hypothetical protein [Candidatus Egerieousia sp.]HPT05067.1 hypothetical protein [Candidatus Egerieousia sp.]
MIIALIDILLIIGIVYLYLKRKKIRAERVSLAKDFSTVSDEFQTLNSSLPVAFFYMTERGYIEDVNSEFESIFKNIENCEYKGFNLFESSSVIPKEDFNHLKKYGVLDIQYHTKSSKYSDLLVRIRKITSFKIKGYIGTVIDKSEDIATSSARSAMYNMFQLAMDKANIAVATVNAFNNSYNVTNAWYDLLYVKPGVTFRESFKNAPSEEFVKVTNFMNRIRNIQFNEKEYAKYYGYNINNTKENKDKIDVTANLRIIFGGVTHYIRFYGILTEYSPDEGKMMTEIVLFNIDEQVNREIKLLESLHKTRSAENLKNKSIVNMSTEIQQPLDDILLDTAKIFCASKEEEKKHLMKELSRSNAELLLTISEVINISRIESDAYVQKFSDVDPGVIVAEVVEEFRAMLRENVFVEYHPTVQSKLSIDIRLVKEIVRDLAISSAKRTHDGSIVFTVREKPEERERGEQIELFIAITDSGTPPSKAEMISNNYKTLVKKAAKTSLEIYIAHHLASILGGRLEFSIEKQFGKDINTVWCRIPAKRAECKNQEQSQ